MAFRLSMLPVHCHAQRFCRGYTSFAVTSVIGEQHREWLIVEKRVILDRIKKMTDFGVHCHAPQLDSVTLLQSSYYFFVSMN
jgi:hypothetical protein